MPRQPGESGSCASIARPDSVSVEGLGWTVPPQVSIIDAAVRLLRRSEAATCQISHSRPNCAQAKASALPHWPAPVSVVSLRMPSCAL